MELPQPGPWIIIPKSDINSDGTLMKELSRLPVCRTEQEIMRLIEHWMVLYENDTDPFFIIPLVAALNAVDLRATLHACIIDMEQDQTSGVDEGIYEDNPREDIINIRALLEKAGLKTEHTPMPEDVSQWDKHTIEQAIEAGVIDDDDLSEETDAADHIYSWGPEGQKYMILEFPGSKDRYRTTRNGKMVGGSWADCIELIKKQGG